MTETNEEEIQQKYFEMQMLNHQATQIKKQMQTIDQQMQELSVAMESIDAIQESTETEILVPISSGVFLKASIQDKEKLLVSVGSNITVPKSFEDTKSILENNILEIGKYKDQMKELMDRIAEKQELIQKEMIETHQDNV